MTTDEVARAFSKLAGLSDAADAIIMEKAALRRGETELAAACKRRAIELMATAEGSTTDAEIAAWEAVNAYEAALNAQSGKERKKPASRTRAMLKKRGVLPAVEHVVSRSKESTGFSLLAEYGLEDFSFEQVVIRFPAHFTPSTVEKAHMRLKAGPSADAESLEKIANG